MIVGCAPAASKDHNSLYGVPTLADLGKTESDCGACLFPGGETEALKRMERMLAKSVSIEIGWIEYYRIK